VSGRSVKAIKKTLRVDKNSCSMAVPKTREGDVAQDVTLCHLKTSLVKSTGHMQGRVGGGLQFKGGDARGEGKTPPPFVVPAIASSAHAQSQGRRDACIARAPRTH